MPYIPKSQREPLNKIEATPQTAGEINYVITMCVQGYLMEHGESYQTYNDIMGVLEGVKLELYRRKIASYEDKKWSENGDVYYDY